MHVCWTNIEHTYTVKNGVTIKKEYHFEELLTTRGEWRVPTFGHLKFDHVIFRPSDQQIGTVGFNVLQQQVASQVRQGMAMHAVTDAFSYMTLAGGSACKFSTVQAFHLLNMVPAMRRLELTQLLYPSVTDFHNLFNLLLTNPVKRQCMPAPVADLVACETSHLQGPPPRPPPSRHALPLPGSLIFSYYVEGCVEGCMRD